MLFNLEVLTYHKKAVKFADFGLNTILNVLFYIYWLSGISKIKSFISKIRYSKFRKDPREENIFELILRKSRFR